MSESQLPAQCTKCGFDFSAFTEFNFCPKCGCSRVKLEQAVGEPTSTNGLTSNDRESTVISNGHESTMIADKPDASHSGQGEVHDSTIEQHVSAIEDAGVHGPSKSIEVEGIGDPTPLAELAKDGTVSTEKDLNQKQPKEAEKLMTNESDTVPAEAEPKIIHSESDCTSAQTHEAGRVEERPIPEDRTSEGVNDSSVASGSSNQVLTLCYVNIHSQNSEYLIQ